LQTFKRGKNQSNLDAEYFILRKKQMSRNNDTFGKPINKGVDKQIKQKPISLGRAKNRWADEV